MESLPCDICRGLCCGPVPVTMPELKNIKKKIKSVPLSYRLYLKNQKRYFGTCIFYDIEKDKCGIHHFKPSICRAFGLYKNLVCFRKPSAAATEDWIVTEDPAGILSIDYTWRDFV